MEKLISVVLFVVVAYNVIYAVKDIELFKVVLILGVAVVIGLIYLLWWFGLLGAGREETKKKTSFVGRGAKGVSDAQERLYDHTIPAPEIANQAELKPGFQKRTKADISKEIEKIDDEIARLKWEIDRLEIDMANYYERDIEAWKRMDPLRMERLFMTLCEDLGYHAEMTPYTGDGGIDGILVGDDGNKIIVQCKRHSKPVGIAAIRELYGTLLHEGVKKGWLVSPIGFTAPTIDFAKGKSIKLIGSEELKDMLNTVKHKKEGGEYAQKVDKEIHRIGVEISQLNLKKQRLTWEMI